MAWTKYQVFLAVFLVITGSINTILVKWADRTKSVGHDGKSKLFNHPFFQAACMFLGELMCLIVFKTLYFIYSRKGDGSEDVFELTKGDRTFNPFILYIPAFCDMTASSVMYIALNLTFASSYQMLRGSLIIFVGLFSMAFLKRILTRNQWIGIALVIVGLVLVGMADFLSRGHGEEYTTKGIVTGDILIVVAQIFQATQMVVEEKFLQGKDIPALQAVGWEGVFGFVTVGLLLIPLYFIRADPPISQHPGDRLEDPIDAFVQIGNSWELAVSVICTILSIAFFNFAGISVTKEISSTTRVVLDSIRTIIIWAFSLAFFKQIFHWLQLVGFIVLIIGMFLYNEITFASCRKRGRDQTENGGNPNAEVSK